MDAIFFKELKLPPPNHNLHIGPGSQNTQTAKMLEKLDTILQSNLDRVVIVQGDTNSVLAGALAATKLNIPVCHVEAGLRSYDRKMPEEVNRIITDHISTWLFPPTHDSEEILASEGISKEKIVVSGNTIVDAFLRFKSEASQERLNKLGFEPQNYFLLTLHRPANVDNKEKIQEALTLIESISKEYSKRVCFPCHPRTRAKIAEFELAIPDCISLIEPVGYLDMLTLQNFAKAVLTDSGGLQEEACILDVPCITLRDSTERPETVTVGANQVVDLDYSLAKKALDHFFSSKASWNNPFGDGNASNVILDTILSADQS
jgi:UDP-N-acetylglucosamine 2-epimerase (non-hydrolysing)